MQYMCMAFFEQLIREEYLFRLNGRGIVEFTIERGDGSAFSPESGGEPRKTAIIQVTILFFPLDPIFTIELFFMNIFLFPII